MATIPSYSQIEHYENHNIYLNTIYYSNDVYKDYVCK